MIFKNGERLIFAGDSVTDCGRAFPLGEGQTGIGGGYVRIIKDMLDAWYPDIDVRVTNAGITGNTSRDLLARFDSDVLSLNPDWVAICIGINDVWRQFTAPVSAETHVLPDEYRNNMEKILFSLRNTVNKTFLFTPYYIEPNTEDPMRKRMDEYAAMCRDMAKKYDCVLIDLQEMFDSYCKLHHSTYLAGDRVHPNSLGSMLIAKEFLKNCEFGMDAKKTENE